MSKTITLESAKNIRDMYEDQMHEKGQFLLYHVEFAVAQGIADPELIVILANLYANARRTYVSACELLAWMIKQP